MRAVVQRVTKATCWVDEKEVGSINRGIVVFLGVGKDDKLEDTKYMANKILNLRIFGDSQDKLNLSLSQVRGEVLIIPQFTIYGNCRKGYRPNFIKAAPYQKAKFLYSKVVQTMREKIPRVEEGLFGAKMRVRVDNEGPVTLILDSK
ncbi:D-tyrosyl-tRNA(Tyr) deacylase [Candidatus Aerophobetes bacterium]|nr:D-tyrosyl-tRNA(Tyr) deacylase [Candidatus Aerophobetes bacterium]